VRARDAAEVEADAADEAGIFVALGGMTDQAGGFVDDQEVVVLIYNSEQRVQGRG